MPFKRLSVYVSALLCVFISYGQEPPAFVFSAVTLDRSIDELHYVSGDEVQALSIYRKQRSETFQYQGAQTLQFFRETGQLDASGAPVRDVLAEVRLPSGGGRYLLLFAPISKAPERYKIVAIPDSWKDFEPGSCRFLNLTPYEIALKLEGAVHRIRAQNFTDVGGDFGAGSHQQAMMVSLPVDGKPRRVFEGLIHFTDTQRMLYIVVPKAGRSDGSVKFIGIPQAAPRS